MAIPDHFIQELLGRIDIVSVVDAAVPLKKAGTNFIACCPFHGEKTPSFTVSPTKQFYHCFGCGAHGTAISFLMEYQGLGFVDAVEDLAKHAGMTVPRESREKTQIPKSTIDLYQIMQQASKFYREKLKKSEPAIAYLKARGLSGQIAARFQIGYAPSAWQGLNEVFDDYESKALLAVGLTVKNSEGRIYDRFRDRIMFPIHNQRGQIIGFGGRILTNTSEDTPKYLNSSETALFQKGQELYGLALARQSIHANRRVIVVEGYMDVVALAQHGIDNVVATLGTATTQIHVNKLMRQTDDIIFCFDGDAAGRKAAWRAAMNALAVVTDGLKLSFLFLPPEHDPDSYVREFGCDAFSEAVSSALTLSSYLLQELSKRHDLGSQESRLRFLNEAKPILHEVRAPGLNLMLRKRVAELTDIEQSELETLLKLDVPKRPQRGLAKASRRPPTLSAKLQQLLILRPELATQLEEKFLPIGLPEREVLLKIIEIANHAPAITTAGLLHSLGSLVSEDLASELLQWDGEDFALEQEFEVVLQQLRGASRQSEIAALLQIAQEQGLKALTPDQREQLQQFRRRNADKE